MVCHFLIGWLFRSRKTFCHRQLAFHSQTDVQENILHAVQDQSNPVLISLMLCTFGGINLANSSGKTLYWVHFLKLLVQTFFKKIFSQFLKYYSFNFLLFLLLPFGFFNGCVRLNLQHFRVSDIMAKVLSRLKIFLEIFQKNCSFFL